MPSNSHETTFRDRQIDERLKKLQRSLKLAMLRQKHSTSGHDEKASPVTKWPSVSSINVNTFNLSTAPSVQSSLIKSEVLASSSNLKNMLRKSSCNTKPETMTTSSVKQYNVQQDNHVDRLVMPPPVGHTVYRAFKEPQDRVCRLSNYEKTASLNRSVSSTVNTFSLKSAPNWISNTNAGDEYLNTCAAPTPTNNLQKIDRVFSKWRVMLNDRYELLIKGTLECGQIAHSKPVIRRYSATCIESKYKHKYILQGNIVDEKHVLPDYICGKFYNGFPDDWENVYQIWRTYVSQGCEVTFRWPTPIADSDDDLKSEMTDMTYINVRYKKPISTTGSCNLNECTKTENLNSAIKKKEKYQNYSPHYLQNYEKSTPFIKSFISHSEKDIIPVIQTKNVKSLSEDNRQNVITTNDINPSLSSRKANKLKDILREDKLNIIIKNLADRNCSQKYIDKIIEMFDCLDYVVSYKTESECNNDSVVSATCDTYDSETVPLQQNLVCDNNLANTNKLENKWMELKNYGHSADLGYRSIRNDTIQLSNPVNIKSKHDEDSDKSESETYAGVPRVSIERVLKAREMSRKPYKRKVRKKTVYPNASKHTSNLSYNVEEVESVHVMNSVAKKNSLPDESCISITEDEVETSNSREQRRAINIIRKPQETFSSHRDIQKNNFDVYEGGKFVTHVQNKQPLSNFETQRVNLNVFIKEQKIPYRKNIQEQMHSQFVPDVDYTVNSDVDIVTLSTNSQKTSGNTASCGKVDQDIVITNENNNFPEKFCTSKLHREFIEQTKSDIAIKKSKPTIISSMPVNLNLKISRADSNAEQPHNLNIMKNEDKQDANVRSVEEIDKKKSMLKTSVATKPVVNYSHSKAITIETDDNKRKIPITNNKNDSDNIKPINSTRNPTNEQPNKLGVEENVPKVLTAWTPKVVHYAKSKSELGLTFQGKLLNEAGHVVHRKFTTDIVARRLSSTLIETVNHEFYELLGHLNDNKHTVPKELVKQCRYGCPAKIEQFCLTWKTQHNNVQEVEEKLHNATMDSLNTPISSRGRRIIPPLCYWEGERVTCKDNTPVYSPGNSQESLLSLTDNSKEIKKNTMNTEDGKKRKVNSKNISKKESVNKQILSPESNKISGTNKNQTIVIEKVSKKSPSKNHKIKIANNVKKFSNSKESQKINSKRRLTQKLSTSSEEEQEVSPRKRLRNSQTNENVDPEAQSCYTMTLRKQQRVETSSNKILRRNTRSRRYAAYSPTKKFENQSMTYIYYQNIPQSENFLSESEESSI